MKKLLILLLFVFSLTAVAQDKRVAILNPEAATSEVTTIHRSMIRGEMEKAICRQSGYTAFTRQDIDQIVKELNFQQSGMVDDNTRKRLGEMKGVDYLCVTRITKEENSYYLEAKFVDVESGTILNPATKYGELTGGSLASMLAACEELAAELVGEQNKVTTSTPSTQNNTSATMNKVKKVAVFVDNDRNDVAYGLLLQVHSSLIYSITHCNGFEGLNIASITSNQTPQDLFKKGQMIGADYVFIAEVSSFDDYSIFINCEIVDMETGQVRFGKPTLIRKNSMNEACMEITKQLLNN